MSVLLLLILFGLFWVVLILPKQRELKRHNALVAALQVGDEVMSGSGIYGTVTEIDGDIVHLEIAPGTEIRVARRAIAARVDAPDAEAEPRSSSTATCRSRPCRPPSPSTTPTPTGPTSPPTGGPECAGSGASAP